MMQPSFDELRAGHFGELGVRVRAERRIDGVEGVMPFGGVDGDAIVGNRHSLRRTVDAVDPGILQLALVLGLEPQRLVRRDQRHVCGVAAEEQRLGDAAAAAADHADLLVGDLIAVADRAIADEAAGKASS